MKIKHKIWIKVGGLTFMLAILFLMTLTFYTAYFNPSKTVLVEINRYGEANVEFILIIIGIILSIGASYLILNEMMGSMIKDADENPN